MYKSFLLFLLVVNMLTNASCQTKPTEKGLNNIPGFYFEVEFASKGETNIEKRGTIDYNRFLSAFDQFPWAEQLKIANQFQKNSPTLSVINPKTEEILWVSAAGYDHDYGYILGHIHTKATESLSGKPEQTRWVEFYLTEDADSVKTCFHLFFSDKIDALVEMYSQMEKYGEGAAPD